jgi:hypothetical protein
MKRRKEHMSKNRFFKAITVLAVVLLAATSLYAGDKSRIGTAAAPQLQIPVGGRNFAMAGSDIAGTEGVDAIYWNPAGLSQVYGGSIDFSTMSYLGDAGIQVNYLAGAYNVGFGVLGVSFQSIDVGDIPLTTNDDPLNESGATYTVDYTTLGITYANKFSDAISFGVSVKYLTESVPRASAEAIMFDFGLQYRNVAGISNLDFGIAAKNIGTDMEYSGTGLQRQGSLDGSVIPEYFYQIPTESFTLPANYQLGLSYNMRFSEGNALKLAGTFVSENLDSDRVLFGGEFTFMDLAMLRLGYSLYPDYNEEQTVKGFVGGLGLKYGLGGFVLRVDYVYEDMKYLGPNHLFNVGFDF